MTRLARSGTLSLRPAVLTATVLLACAVPAPAQRQIAADVYHDKLMGMWYGELVGNYAGRPVEGDVLRGGLTYTVDWAGVLATNTWVADDDTCFEYLYADLLSQSAAPTATQIRQAWVDNIPIWSVYIANRQARWLMDAPPTGMSLEPPLTGSHRYNMHAPAIDAQITTEALGSLTPGLRQAAADLSGTFAQVSNEGFAVHAAQFYAAMYAAGALETDVPTVIDQALAIVPTTSRSYEVVDAVRTFYQADANDWRACQTMLHDTYGQGSSDGRHRGWVESSTNLGLTTMALLYGEGDFRQTVEIAVQGGYDADCNPATAGGLLGMIKGYQDVGGAGGGILDELPATPSSDFDVRCLTDVGSLTTVTGVADLMAQAAELQIVAAGGSITGSGPQRTYVLPDDVLAAPVELPQPEGPAGLVGRVQDAGGSVGVSASIYRNNPAYDRHNILSIIDGVTDYRYNGWRPYDTNDWVYPQPAGGDWYALEFDRDMTFHKVVFYEGDLIYDGTNNNPRLVTPRAGFFVDLIVEVLAGGQWQAATNLQFSEPLDANAFYQVIELTFDAASGSAVRIRGTAGGTREYTTIVELEAHGAMGLPGDCDEDGLLEGSDLHTLRANMGLTGQWADGDFTFDGAVDAADYVGLKRSWMAAPAGAPAVPEPASLILLAVGAAALRRRR